MKKELLESIEIELEQIKNKKIIVEGKNDKKCLEEFGFTNVITLNKPLFEIVEDVKDEEVVILTDLDSEGKKLYSKLYKDFSRRGIRVDNKIRHLLFKTKLRQIEGLKNYLDKKKL